MSEFILNPFSDNATFDMESFINSVKISVRALNEVLHEGLPLHPLKEQRESVDNWRQIGLGIFGWHDALIKLGIRYGSKDSLEIANKIGFNMINNAILESAMLTNVYGSYPMYNKDAILASSFFKLNTDNLTKSVVAKMGLANSQLLTIPPTGSTGTMLGISTGIEPIYNIVSYTRKTESLHGKDHRYTVYTPIVKQYMELKNITDEKDLPSYFNCAMDLNYRERINMQSTWQKCIDASISSTVNVPFDFTIEEVKDLYLYGWQKGLKGCTIYRNDCKRKGILSTDTAKENKNNDEQVLEWGTTIISNDDLIGLKRKIMSGCGSLHVLAWFDPMNGRLTELYLSKGSLGGCNSFMTSLSRIISAGMRTGLSFDYLIDQLKSAPACPSYTVRTATKKDTSRGNCCPAAIANALIEMQKEVFDELGIDDEEETKEVKQIVNVKIDNVGICPECNCELEFTGGCNSCPNCGYSRCE